MGLLTARVGVSLTLSPAFGTLFLLLGCLVQFWYEGLCLVFLWLVMLCSSDVLGRPVLFWRETSSRSGEWGRRELRVEGGKAVVRMFHVKKIKNKSREIVPNLSHALHRNLWGPSPQSPRSRLMQRCSGLVWDRPGTWWITVARMEALFGCDVSLRELWVLVSVLRLLSLTLFALGSALGSLHCCVLALVSRLSTPGIQPNPAVSCVSLFSASSPLPCLSPLSLTLLHLWGPRSTSTTEQKTKNTEPRCFVKLEILMLKFWLNYRRHWDPHKNLQKRAGHSQANLRSLLCSRDKIPMVCQWPVLSPLQLYYTSCKHARFWSWDKIHRGSWEWVSPPPLSSPRITSRFQYLLENKCNWPL